MVNLWTSIQSLLWPNKQSCVLWSISSVHSILWNKMCFLQTMWLQLTSTLSIWTQWDDGYVKESRNFMFTFFVFWLTYIHGSPIYMFVFVFHSSFGLIFVANISILTSREWVCAQWRQNLHEWLIVFLFLAYTLSFLVNLASIKFLKFHWLKLHPMPMTWYGNVILHCPKFGCYKIYWSFFLLKVWQWKCKSSFCRW